MIIKPNESAKEKIGIVAELINLHPFTLEYLKKTERALIDSIPTTEDNGTVNIFKDYLIYHSILQG